MRERRSTPRHRCRLRCALRHGTKRDDGTVLDVSLSGLSIQTSLALDQGDEVELEIVEGRVRVQALAWNVRRIRRGQETAHVVGMMLAEVGPEYEALVLRIAGAQPQASRAQRPAGPKPAAPSGPPPQPERRAPPPLPGPRRLPWWRLRVKETQGPRTRVVTLAAASAEEAAAQSLAEMGAGWEVLEVRPATAGR